MKDQTENTTNRTGGDSDASGGSAGSGFAYDNRSGPGPAGGQPDTVPDFTGWDRAQWRAYRHAQKQAFREARWREKGRAWEEYSPDWESRSRPESDPLGAVTWAVIFVWAGIVLLANNLGWLDVWISGFSTPGLGIQRFSLGAFSIVFLGVALILLCEVALRLLAPSLYRPVLGTLVLAGILLGVGLDGVIAWNVVWPVILILLGAYIILGGALRREN